MKKTKEAPENFRTLFEFSPTEENLKLAIRAIARRKGVITADDLHQLDYSLCKLGKDRRCYGANLRSLADEGFLKKLDWVSSSRTTCHNRPILQWESLEVKRRC
jgi:hypothetical protein